MKLSISALSALALGAYASPLPDFEDIEARNLTARSTVQGFDISHYQSSVNYQAAYNGGLRFAYVKATEGTTYQDPMFSTHYNGLTKAGFIRGGYHYASGTGDGSEEANYFLKHGGGWSGDGITLPGMLDLEGDCKSVSWIRNFINTYYAATGRYVVLYSSPSWWSSCTGNSNAFVSNNPLMMACYNANPCTPQGGWPYYTIWQYKDSNTYGGDSDVFNGDMTQLKKLATG